MQRQDQCMQMTVEIGDAYQQRKSRRNAVLQAMSHARGPMIAKAWSAVVAQQVDEYEMRHCQTQRLHRLCVGYGFVQMEPYQVQPTVLSRSTIIATYLFSCRFAFDWRTP